MCSCGFSLAENTAHKLSCEHLGGYTEVHRHDDVKDTCSRVLKSWGFSVISEPEFYVYDDGSLKRPDLCVFDGFQSIVTDITIVDPAATTAIAKGSDRVQGISATQASERKARKHGAAVESADHIFIPVAIEAYGHCDLKVDAFLKRLSQSIVLEMRKVFIAEALDAMACAVQRGNSRILTAACRRRLES